MYVVLISRPSLLLFPHITIIFVVFGNFKIRCTTSFRKYEVSTAYIIESLIHRIKIAYKNVN